MCAAGPMISRTRRAPAKGCRSPSARRCAWISVTPWHAAAKRSGLLLNVQGASAFAESNPIQRVWRDLEMASRHGLLAGEVPLEIYGRALVGNFEPLSPMV